MANFLVIDTETGGFIPETHALLSVAAILLAEDSLEEVERYSALVLDGPEKEITAEALAVNHIDPLEVYRSGTQVADVIARLNQYMDQAPVLVFQDADFDLGFLAPRGFEWEKAHRIVDTMKASRNLYPRGSHNLANMMIRIQSFKEYKPAHTAEGDAEMTADLLRHFHYLTSGRLEAWSGSRYFIRNY